MTTTHAFALPLRLEFCFTRIADGEDAAWKRARFREVSAAFGTPVHEEEGRLGVDPRI